MRDQTAKTPQNYKHELENKRIAMPFSRMLKGMIGASLVVFLASAHATGIVVNVSGAQLTASTNGAPTDHIILRVAGPDGFSTKKKVDGDNLSWYLPAGAPDGHYRYDVYAKESDSSGRSSSNADAADAGHERFSVRESGRFRVSGGTMDLPHTGDQAAAESAGTIERTLAAVLNFVIPAAEAADLDISDGTPKLNFDDTDNVSGTTNWDISANSFSSSPDNFYIRNHDTGNQLIFIEQGAGDRALEMDASGDIDIGQSQLFVEGSSGDVGIGTTTPGAPLDIAGSFPGIQMDNGTGTWRLSAFGDHRFGVRDTDDMDHPFLIEDGAPNFALFVDGTGIGVGTGSPTAPLHVVRNDDTFEMLHLEQNNTGVVQDRNMMQLDNNGGIRFEFLNAELDTTWRFQAATGGADVFEIAKVGTGEIEMRVDASGNLDVAGAVNSSSSRTVKTDIEPVAGADTLAKLADLPIAEWRYTDDTDGARHLGPMAEDFYAAFELGADNKHIAPQDMAGVALAAVKALKEQSDRQQQRIAELEQQNQKLQGALSELEQLKAQVAALQADQGAEQVASR